MDIVENYYNQSTKYLMKFWSDQKSLSLHYGFWYPETKSRSQAFINQYHVINELIKPKKGEKVLDVGCGIGGASIWLANETGANFVGITISDEQIRLANNFIQGHNITNLVSIKKEDFFHTSFPENTFDKAFAIESVCHSYPQEYKVFKELNRILKKNAIFLLSDSALLHRAKNMDQKKWVNNFCQGWAMKDFATIEEVSTAIKSAGFKILKIIDRTELVKKNINMIYRIGIMTYPFLKVQQLLGLVSKVIMGNHRAMFAQKKLMDAKIVGYYSILAQKI